MAYTKKQLEEMLRRKREEIFAEATRVPIPKYQTGTHHVQSKPEVIEDAEFEIISSTIKTKQQK